MTEHDESLEVGIAAGLDVPTAMVVSELGNTAQPPRQPARPASWSPAVIVAAIAGAAMTALAYWLR